jgi:large subunit ribosomal protein L17
MRHSKRRHKLGVSGPHRLALLANLSVALITHGRIKTTLAKAKALRPFVEKVITLAKKAESSNEAERKLHFRRLAISRINDPSAVATLFDKRVTEFMERPGGYTRIYKLGQRIGDAAEMALIELIDGNDEGYAKRPSSKKAAEKSVSKAAEKTPEDDSVADETAEAVEEATIAEVDEVKKEAAKGAAESPLDEKPDSVAESTDTSKGDETDLSAEDEAKNS